VARTPHLLIVDDDREIRSLLSGFMTRNGFRVSAVPDARQAMQALANARVDLALVDIMLPGEDGLALSRKIREHGPTPIILVTAMSDDTDRIIGLELGADDYVVKPFNPRELLARIRAVLRRVSVSAEEDEAAPPVFSFEGWTLDSAKRTLVGPDGALVPLGSSEFDLLLAFLERPQRVLNRDQLLDIAHGRVANVLDRSIDVQISRLRRRIEPNPAEPTFIKTVRGDGYIFTPAVTRAGGEVIS